ncbi:ATP-binding protein [Candidatus Poriferisodalis sp.]|uniref:ATP-binding protein n=1 Tax=Candidatus Poriferisodalis sp. TaxID=3101277 RepID=UPI003B0119C7
MDRRLNPYTPNAGARPPVLVGREDELEEFDVLLHRLEAGHTEKSLIVVGLRGVGKTVLLGEFRQLALDREWHVVEIEVSKWDDAQFRRSIARELRRVLHSISARSWSQKLRGAMGALRSFTLKVDPEGHLTIGLDADVSVGVADSGDLDADLSDLLVGVGEAAREHGTGVVLLLDELHFLSRPQMEALIAAVHKTVQRSLPITAAAAGLPQIHELVGDAKTYAERLFKFPSLGRLADADAREVLREPARLLDVRFGDEALNVGLEFSEGYPYFLQEFGEAAWDLASGSSIDVMDGLRAKLVVQEKLDSGFFKVRLERTTELQKAYLRAMAELGPDAQLASRVADLLERTSSECGPTRKQLIDKGLLYATEHGYAAFTVPGFDEYLKRAIPELAPPPIRRRPGRGET